IVGGWVTDAFSRCTGYTPEELPTGESWARLYYTDDLPRIQQHLQTILAGESDVAEYRFVTKTGDIRWVRSYDRPVWDEHEQRVVRVYGAVQDITERKQAEEQLKAALQAKTALLQEVHHRTRNNMQVLSALLMYQAEYADDQVQLQDVLNALQARIDAMALVHHKLHQEDLMIVNLQDYIQDLTHMLLERHQLSTGRRITVTFDLEPLAMTIDPAVPFGLLLHEILSNALTHGFPHNQPGEIQISLHSDENGTRELRVRDTGLGLPEDVDLEHTTTMGMQLMNILTQHIQGRLDIQRKEPGTEVMISFKEPHYPKRI
ncbi:PAS domain-containing protein, partial [candidate division KSB3 bacterium]|nr:PAS domain-containing protein [candidate division KSB3 bacterium]MBD3325233.1 PAS domain-containing protein [candidate division KSB3 bacterium]